LNFALRTSSPLREVQSAKSEVQKRSQAAWFRFVLRSSLFVLPAPTIEPDERLAERERVWQTHRAGTIDPPTKEEFDKFWDAQHGLRSLFLVDEVAALPAPVAFKVYGRALEWGYPMDVGYRYLSVPQSVLLLRLAAVPPQVCEIRPQEKR